VDLSDHTGMEVEIVLSAIAEDDTGGNYVPWLDPRVVREAEKIRPNSTNRVGEPPGPDILNHFLFP
jgi:hypothetical protein